MSRGLTLLEVVVAVAVLAVGMTTAERLIAQSVAAVTADAGATRAMLLARALLAEAEAKPPEPGRGEGVRDGLRFVRDVEPTPHPRLRRVRVRVSADRPGTTCELVEVMRVPAG